MTATASAFEWGSFTPNEFDDPAIFFIYFDRISVRVLVCAGFQR